MNSTLYKNQQVDLLAAHAKVTDNVVIEVYEPTANGLVLVDTIRVHNDIATDGAGNCPADTPVGKCGASTLMQMFKAGKPDAASDFKVAACSNTLTTPATDNCDTDGITTATTLGSSIGNCAVNNANCMKITFSDLSLTNGTVKGFELRRASSDDDIARVSHADINPSATIKVTWELTFT